MAAFESLLFGQSDFTVEKHRAMHNKIPDFTVGPAVIYTGVELYQASSAPYIDFHRAADPAGDGGADYNMRLINDASGVLHVVGGRLIVGPSASSGSLEPLEVSGTASGIRMIDRDNGAASWVIYPTAGLLHFYDGVADRMTLSRTTGILELPYGGLNLLDHVLSLRGNGDSNSVFYNVGSDVATIQGFNNVRMRTSVNSRELTWNNAGVLSNSLGTLNLGGGLYAPGVITGNSGVKGATLRSRADGNNISFDWAGGTFHCYVDVTDVVPNVKNFVIEHPLDSSKYLIHACIEGPEATVCYRGKACLCESSVVVELPSYFEALCHEEGRSVQLTCVAHEQEDNRGYPELHASYPKDGTFTVSQTSTGSAHDQEFWWEVKAVRKDVPAVNVEPLKKDIEVMGQGPYTYYKEKEKGKTK